MVAGGDSNKKCLSVCVVGAGAAGLCAARHLVSDNRFSKVDVMEKSEELGGTWVYSEDTGYDSYGQPIHSSMYKSLRTNLPKEVMGFPDYPVPGEKSYLPAKEMWAFLKSYSDHFGVTEKIKFNSPVQMIKPIDNDKWEVTYRDLKSGVNKIEQYDVVMICNGHYSTPFIPTIKGIETFKGHTMHSHDYRVPEIYKDKRVAVLGAGPSGLDIAVEISAVAKKVILSHHLKEKLSTVFPDNLVQKPDLCKVNGSTVHFADGTSEEVDCIFYCTGYLYNFPFLDSTCGITVNDNHVTPLYKHMVNINYPSMCFIGVPFYVCAFSMFDLQVRYYVNYLKGIFQLPSKEEMMNHMLDEERMRTSKGVPNRQAHMMGPDQVSYYATLADESKTENLPLVLSKLRENTSNRFLDDIVNYRNDIYRIIDDYTYEVINGLTGKSEIVSTLDMQ